MLACLFHDLSNDWSMLHYFAYTSGFVILALGCVAAISICFSVLLGKVTSSVRAPFYGFFKVS
jgi:hypothetical protein